MQVLRDEIARLIRELHNWPTSALLCVFMDPSWIRTRVNGEADAVIQLLDREAIATVIRPLMDAVVREVDRRIPAPPIGN